MTAVLRPILLIVTLSCLIPCTAPACPEVVVPMDPADPAFHSVAWRKALRNYKGRKHARTLRIFKKQDARLRKAVDGLFHPAADGKTKKSSEIQRWLRRHVHTKHPGVMITGDRFTYPPIVWWAWADTACRAGDYSEAHVALTRLRQIRPGGDLLHHRILVLLRLDRLDAAKRLLPKAPPDAFLTPYLEGLIARASGDVDTARTKLLEAQRSAMLEDRRKAVKRELRALGTPGSPG